MFNEIARAGSRVRRAGWMAALAAITLAPVTGWAAEAPTALPEVVVYKAPACDCCGRWAEHLRRHGLDVREVLTQEVGAIKIRHGVPPKMASCHTAVAGDYVIEGHVPASAVKRLLEERPDLAGIAVAGMPMGSPGMEGPNPVTYAVHGFDSAGNVTLFSVAEGQSEPQ